MKKILLNNGTMFHTQDVSVKSQLTFITIKHEVEQTQMGEAGKWYHWSAIPQMLLELVKSEAIYDYCTKGDNEIKITLRTKNIESID